MGLVMLSNIELIHYSFMIVRTNTTLHTNLEPTNIHTSCSQLFLILPNLSLAHSLLLLPASQTKRLSDTAQPKPTQQFIHTKSTK